MNTISKVVKLHVQAIAGFSWPAEVHKDSSEDEMIATALMHENKREYKEAIKLLFSLADKGSIRATNHLLLMSAEEKPGVQQVLNKFLEKADRESAAVLFLLGYRAAHGFGVEKSNPSAISFWELAAEKELPEALFNLGIIYYEGCDGVKQDYVKAHDYFARAAAKGHPRAQFNLGVVYQQGLGVDPDLRKAEQCYWGAANAKHPGALFNLGGISIKRQDFPTAYDYYKMAAEEGHPKAPDALRHMCERGYF